MPNEGKVRRVLREAVEVLVEELGRNDAANMLEIAAAQLRGVEARPKRARKRARARIGNRSSA